MLKDLWDSERVAQHIKVVNNRLENDGVCRIEMEMKMEM